MLGADRPLGGTERAMETVPTPGDGLPDPIRGPNRAAAGGPWSGIEGHVELPGRG